MKIRFYENTLTIEQIIELANADDNFKVGKSKPVIVFCQRHKGFDQWYDNSGSIDVFADAAAQRNKTNENYMRLYPYVKFNSRQLELFKNFIEQNFQKIECPVYQINNQNEFNQVQKLIGEIIQLHQFPFYMGKEPGFTFQSKSLPMKEDYIFYDERKIYQYQLKTL